MKKIILCIWMALVAVAGDYKIALEEANKSNKLLLLFVESSSCPYCIQMKKEIFSQANFLRRLEKKYVILMLEGVDALDEGYKTKYFPTTYLIDPKTKQIVDELPGYMQPLDFMDFLKEVYNQERG